jgi:hypothetical protein
MTAKATAPPNPPRVILAGQRQPGQEIACTISGFPIGDLNELATAQATIDGVHWLPAVDTWRFLAPASPVVVRDTP